MDAFYSPRSSRSMRLRWVATALLAAVALGTLPGCKESPSNSAATQPTGQAGAQNRKKPTFDGRFTRQNHDDILREQAQQIVFLTRSPTLKRPMTLDLGTSKIPSSLDSGIAVYDVLKNWDNELNLSSWERARRQRESSQRDLGIASGGLGLTPRTGKETAESFPSPPKDPKADYEVLMRNYANAWAAFKEPPAPTPRHDRFKDRTILEVSASPEVTRGEGKIGLRAVMECTGNRVKEFRGEQADIHLRIRVTEAVAPSAAEQGQVILLIDGQRETLLRDPTITGSEVAFRLSPVLLKRMAAANFIEGQIGDIEFTLGSTDIWSLSQLASESKLDKPRVLKTYPPLTDRSKPVV